MDKKNSDKDEDNIISVSPGKQYVRGRSRSEKRLNALDAAGRAAEDRNEAHKQYINDLSPENKEKYESSVKADRMLWSAYKEEAEKGWKKGGSVRGAGLAQRGQGKMRMC